MVPQPPPPRQRWRAALAGAAILTALVLAGAVCLGALTAWRVEHAVHHVAADVRPVTAAATGGSPGHAALLVAVRLPDGRADVLLLHDHAGRAEVLSLPGRLATAASGGRRALDQLDPEAARPVVATVEALGVPVAHYIGLDLAHLPRRSVLGRVVDGQTSIGGLVGNPLGAAHLLTAVAGRLFLGPRTSLQGALDLLTLRSCRPLRLPVTPAGTLVRPAPAAGAVVERFLDRDPSPACRTPVTGLLRTAA